MLLDVVELVLFIFIGCYIILYPQMQCQKEIK